MTVHPTAIVDSSAKIGANVSIGAFSVIGPGVVLGNGTNIHTHATLEYAELGASCEVYPYTSIGLPAQHLGYKGEPSRVLVGEKTIFREGVTVHRGTAFDASETKIGKECFFMAMSHVAHDCRIGDNVVMANGAVLGGHAEIGDRTFISGLVAVHQFVRVGKGAMLSGGAMVTQNVPPYSIAQGDRATWRGLNLVGLKRSGMTKESIRNLKNAFRIIYSSGLRLEEALKDPIFSSSDPSLKELKDFFANIKRGFIRPANKTQHEDETE